MKKETQQTEIEMVPVKGGTFLMGSPDSDTSAYNDEKPQHRVTLSDFEIGKYPVTQAQWKAVMGDNPSYFQGDDLPVETVSWQDVQDFIQKLNQQTGKNYRLPTEAEWEYAARGGNKSKGYQYAGGNDLKEVVWYGDNSGSKTHRVGDLAANELGLFDMSGNVWEWCADWYGNYEDSGEPALNPQGPASGLFRVIRGGSWFNDARDCRVSYRNDYTPENRNYDLGFRLVSSPQFSDLSKKDSTKSTGRDDLAKGTKKERIELNYRFIQALDYLESKGIVQRYSHRKNTDELSISYGDLAIIMGDDGAVLPTSRIADYRNQKRFIDYPEAIRFAESFDIRKEWIRFGDGPMLGIKIPN